MATGKRNPERFQGQVLRYHETKLEREERQRQERDEYERPLRVGKLNTALDVARYQARLIRRTEKKLLDSNKAYKLAAMARMLANTIELGIIEKRVKSLEEHAQTLRNGSFGRASDLQAGAQGEKPQHSGEDSSSDNTCDNKEDGENASNA